MTYIEYIRQMTDGQLAHFINGLQPEIELWMISMERALSYRYEGLDVYHGLNGDARSLMHIMYKDYDLELKRLNDKYNPGHHVPWEDEKHPYVGRHDHELKDGENHVDNRTSD